MKKLLKILTMVAAVLTTAVVFATCKQFRDDPEEFLRYWTSEVVPVDFSINVPVQTSTDGALCIPSATDVKLTIKLRNPRNFTLVMPTSSDNAGKVIYFPGLSTQPVYGTDYMLDLTANDTLKLTYTQAFLEAHEWSNGGIGPEITFISTDGRKFSKKFSLNIEANTPPPEIGDIKIAKTQTGGYYALCFDETEGMTPMLNGKRLHKDIKAIRIQKEGGSEVTIPLTIKGDGSGFDIPSPLPEGLLSSVDTIFDTPPSHGSWTVYIKTYTELAASDALPKKYTVRLIDEKGLSSAPKEAKTLGSIPDISDNTKAWKNLKQAVADAQEGGVITVMNNVIATNDPDNSGEISVTKSLTIKGKNGAVLDAQLGMSSPPTNAPASDFRIFTVTGDNTELTLENLTLKNGKTNTSIYEYGGAISASQIKKLSLKNCNIEACTACGGGGIYLNGGVEAVLEECTIMYCQTTGSGGGAIYAGASLGKQPIVRIKGGKIENNTGHALGGAINITRGSLYINTDKNGNPDNPSTKTEIGINTLKASGGQGNSGGGIYCYWDTDKPGKLKIHNVKIWSCTVKAVDSDNKSANGAGISVYGKGDVLLSSVTLYGCEFDESGTYTLAEKLGGGICLRNGAEATIKDCTFDRCKANQGGAFYIETGKANIENCTFTQNIADDSGGALHIGNTSDDCDVIINDSVIGGSTSNANTAYSKGGGICVYRGTCTVKKVNIQDNTANIGSGIWLHGAYNNTAKLTLEERVKIQNNHLMIGKNTDYPAFVTAHNLNAESDIKIRPEVYSDQIDKPLVKAAGTKPDNWETLFELVEMPPGQTWELKKNDAGTELILKKTQ